MCKVTVKPHPQVLVYHQLHSLWRGIRALLLPVTDGEAAAAFLLLGTAFHWKYGSIYNIFHVSETFSRVKYKCEFGLREEYTDCQDEKTKPLLYKYLPLSPYPIYNPDLHCHCLCSSLPRHNFAFTGVCTAHHPASFFSFYPAAFMFRSFLLSLRQTTSQPPLCFPLISDFSAIWVSTVHLCYNFLLLVSCLILSHCDKSKIKSRWQDTSKTEKLHSWLLCAALC